MAMVKGITVFFLVILLNVESILSQNVHDEKNLPPELLDLLSTDRDRALLDDPFLAEIIEEEKKMNMSKSDPTKATENTKIRSIWPSNNMSLENAENTTDLEITDSSSTNESSQSSAQKTEFLIHEQNRDTPIPSISSTMGPEEVEEASIVPRSSKQLSWVRIPQPITGALGSVSRIGHKVKNTFTKEDTTERNQPIFTPSSHPHPDIHSHLNGDDIEEEIITPTREEKPPIVCNKTQTIYADTCYAVLQKGEPCKDGEWLVEDEITNKGKCVANNCTELEVPFGNICVRSGSYDHCHPGMRVYVYKNGKTECDCKTAHIFNEKDGNCYAALRKGPCPNNQIFTVNKHKNETICQINPCLTDGYVCNAPKCPRQRNCVELDKDTCPQGGLYTVNATTFTVECTLPTTPDKVVGNVPTLVCAPGSRRDILGSCRKPSDITFS